MAYDSLNLARARGVSFFEMDAQPLNDSAADGRCRTAIRE